MRIDPVMIFLIVLFLAAISLIVYARVDARRERRRELANRAMAGTYRVVQTTDKTFYVQKYVHDYPDCKYYLPDCDSGAYTCRWHWKFLAGFSFKESALQYMEREIASDEAEAKRAAASEKAEKERRAGLEVSKVIIESKK